MKRRLLNFLTGLSMLLCVAAVALWVRSFFVQDVLRWATTRTVGDDVRRTTYEFFSVRGHNVLRVESKTYTPQEFDRARHPHELPDSDQIYLFIDDAVHGVGSRACGFDVLPQHALWPSARAFALTLSQPAS